MYESHASTALIHELDRLSCHTIVLFVCLVLHAWALVAKQNGSRRSRAVTIHSNTGFSTTIDARVTKQNGLRQFHAVFYGHGVTPGFQQRLTRGSQDEMACVNFMQYLPIVTLGFRQRLTRGWRVGRRTKWPASSRKWMPSVKSSNKRSIQPHE